MFLLMRRISAYTSYDLLLGVFATPDEDEAAKAVYARVREAEPEADPWKDQAYKECVPVGQDLKLEQLPGEFPTGATVFVVSNHRSPATGRYTGLAVGHGLAVRVEAPARRGDIVSVTVSARRVGPQCFGVTQNGGISHDVSNELSA